MRMIWEPVSFSFSSLVLLLHCLLRLLVLFACTQEGILHLVLKPPSTCRWRTLRPFSKRPQGVFHPHLWAAGDPFRRCRPLVACPSHGVSLASPGATFGDVTWCIDLVTSFDAIVVSFCLFIFSDAQSWFQSSCPMLEPKSTSERCSPDSICASCLSL